MPSTSEDQPILGGMHICRPKPFNIKIGQSIGLRLMSDLHIGAAHVDYKLIQKEIFEAEEKGDRVLINGDLFDFILPSDKKRYDPDVIHPRIVKAGGSKMINAAVDWAVELLAPVADKVDMLGVGNHEVAVTKHHSVDATEMVWYKLEEIARTRDPEHVIHYGGYTGFVDYRIRPSHKANGGGARWVLYYHHGSGGAAPVTKGLIDFNRRDTFIDSDAVWLGHKHNRLCVSVEKLRCPQTGDDVGVRNVYHLMTGAYFQTYVGQNQKSVRAHGRRSNYAADAGMAPQGKGGLRVTLTMQRVGGLGVQVIQ